MDEQILLMQVFKLKIFENDLEPEEEFFSNMAAVTNRIVELFNSGYLFQKYEIVPIDVSQ